MAPEDNGVNGHSHEGRENGDPPLRRSAIRAMVQDFSPLWFTWCMNSGALAELLHECPYKFSGIGIIADIFFVTDLVLYAIFSTIFIARFIWFRRAAYEEVCNDIKELTFVSCWSIGFMTLTANVAFLVSTASWGGYPFSIVAYVMWWFVQTWNMVLLFWAFTILITRYETPIYQIPMSIIIPAVSVSTVGVTGATISAYAKDLSARLAVPVMILCFQWTGIGILIGLILSTYLFQGLLTNGWPAADATPTLFMFVGPMGQSSASLQTLGAAALTYGRFAAYDTGPFLTAESAKAVYPVCVLIALLLNGLGIIWVIFAIIATIYRASRRELRWTPNWNAAIFPNATLVLSMTILSIDLDSPAYRVIVCIFICILIALFLLNLVYTVLWIFQGKLLIVREDWRVKKAMEESKDA